MFQALSVINYLLFRISYESKVAGSATARVYKNIDDSMSHMHTVTIYNMYASSLPVAANQRLPHHNSQQIRRKYNNIRVVGGFSKTFQIIPN